MEKTIRQDWIKALRSGEYKQGSNALKTQHDGELVRYCCLGVLAKILGAKFVKSRKRLSTNATYWHLGKETKGNGLLPPTYVDLDRETQDDLACMNDGDNKTFNQIADWIEEHVSAA